MKEKLKRNLFIIIVLISPGFWSSITKFQEFFKEWSMFNVYTSANFSSYLREEKINNIKTMRWANVDNDTSSQFISKAFYNKATLVGDQVLGLLTYFSPKPFFHSGNADFFSPHSVEPIPLVFLPFFVFGFIKLIGRKKPTPVLLYLFSGVIAFAAGKNNFSYLFPELILILYTVAFGMNEAKLLDNKKIYYPVFAYCLFTFGRYLYFL